MVMPVSKKDIVAGKYFVLFAFSLIGIIFGLVVGTAGNVIAESFSRPPEEIASISPLLSALLALSFSTVFGSISIPLAIRFGTEKGRILVLASFLIPAGICYAAYRLLTALGINITEDFITALLYASPIPALLWNYIMYKLSCVFKLAVLCGMFFNIGIVYAFLIFLFVGKMCFCIVDKFRYQMYNAVRFVLQKVVIKQFMGFLGKLK